MQVQKSGETIYRTLLKHTLMCPLGVLSQLLSKALSSLSVRKVELMRLLNAKLSSLVEVLGKAFCSMQAETIFISLYF